MDDITVLGLDAMEVQTVRTIQPQHFDQYWQAGILSWKSDFEMNMHGPYYAELLGSKRERNRTLSKMETSLQAGKIINARHLTFHVGPYAEYEPGPEESLAASAEREGKQPRELAFELLMENDGKGLIYLPLLGYADGDLEAIRAMMVHPRSVFSLSDGGAHCGLIADASIPTYLLTHWVRDRTRGERIAIEDIVEQQCRKTARFYGFEDRGTLEPGMLADLNVIDFDGLHIHPPKMVYDLTAGGNRLVQKFDCYRYTIKSGQVTFEEGEPTGALPGKLLRGPQPSPAP